MFTSTKDSWERLMIEWAHIPDKELLRRGTNQDGSMRLEIYKAGNYEKWNKSNNRQEGETYEGACRELTILNLRLEQREIAPISEEERQKSLSTIRKMKTEFSDRIKAWGLKK